MQRCACLCVTCLYFRGAQRTRIDTRPHQDEETTYELVPLNYAVQCYLLILTCVFHIVELALSYNNFICCMLGEPFFSHPEFKITPLKKSTNRYILLWSIFNHESSDVDIHRCACALGSVMKFASTGYTKFT